MTDDDLIRRDDALRKIHWLSSADWTKPERRAADAISEAIATLPVVTSSALIAKPQADALADVQKLRGDRDHWHEGWKRAMGEFDAKCKEANAQRTSAEAAEARAEAAVTLLERVQRALKPFADRVFNDNGDCTIRDTHTLTPSDYWNAQVAERMARAAIGGAE